MMKRLIGLIGLLLLLMVGCTRPVDISDQVTVEAASQEEADEPVLEQADEEEDEGLAGTAVPTATDIPPTNTPEPEPTAIPEPTNPPVPLGDVQSEDVVILAEDDLELDATFYAAEGLENGPGVILLHMLGSNRSIWESVGLANALAENGYAVLALDMRGHGDTGRSQDWVQAEDDIQRVWQYLVDRPEVDAERTAVIGASIGANMALIATANEPAIKTAVLLSPGLVYRGVTIEDRLPDIGERPLFIVASENDAYSAGTANTLAETAVGEVTVQIYESAGHGTNMFAPQPDLTPFILDWLAQYLAE